MRINSRHTNSDRGLDAYFTPREAVVSLIKIENDHIPKVIWEPACGNGAIVIPLREAGFFVAASDICDYGFNCRIVDYLKVESYPGYRGIITNPPFKLATEFATKALSEVPYLALLLRTNFLESQDRLPFFVNILPPEFGFLLVDFRRCIDMAGLATRLHPTSPLLGSFGIKNPTEIVR